MGHAITGGGFFNIDVEPIRDDGQGDQFAAVVKFKGTPLSELQLSDELKNLVDDLWDWQVTKVSDSEFTVRFPSRATLKMSTGSGKLYLALSKTDVEIREAFLAPQPGKALPSTWVRLMGVPPDLMEVDRLMAAMVMVGRPLEVDELSLRKWATEPVRMRFQCRYPERVKGMVQVFVNGVPFNVGVMAELGGRGHGAAGDDGPPKPPASPRDDEGDEDFEDQSMGDYTSMGGGAVARTRRRRRRQARCKVAGRASLRCSARVVWAAPRSSAGAWRALVTSMGPTWGPSRP
jgi:hypothetical protein